MGIYIKNMEMPESCHKCPFLDYEEGFCLAKSVKSSSGWYTSSYQPLVSTKIIRDDNCPLVLVPPHGRLIEAVELTRHEFTGLQADKKISYQMGWNDALMVVAENATTIIPASGGKADE